MGLYNFQPRFVPRILAGTKTHTIRSERKHPDKPGNIMHLYTGLRTKRNCFSVVPCICVEPIRIDQDGSVYLQGKRLSPSECDALAKRDGFDSFTMRFWEGRLPFAGQVYHWRKMPDTT
jgi:uncharacterized protein YqfB (UPF0267 family)